MKEDKEYVIPLDEEKLKKLGNNIEKYIGYKYQYELLQERIDKAIEYITSYETISTIQGLDKIEQNKTLDEKTIIVMVDRCLEVHDKLLDILQGKDENK